MAWTQQTVGVQQNTHHANETYTLPASATTEYTSLIDFMGPAGHLNNRWVVGWLNASAVTGTNLDIALYGSSGPETTSTKFLLLDALVADITATGNNPFILDLNAYPAPYYWIAWTSDADESANTIEVELLVPKVGQTR